MGGDAFAVDDGAQGFHDGAAGVGVELAGGFVGDDQGGPVGRARAMAAPC
ncbi:hypothetical protein [Actinacidiphila glaucinigra]